MAKGTKNAFSRRNFLKGAAMFAALGPFVHFPGRTQIQQKTLKIAKLAHFLPEYDWWFEAAFIGKWGELHDTRVVVEHIPVESIHASASGEIRAGKGHDVFMFPWPPAEFHQHTIDHAEVYQSVAFKYGTLDRLAHRSTFNSKTKNYFAFADYWIPTPLHYFEDYWRQVGMPFGPMHYGSLRSGGKRIREELGIPSGLAKPPPPQNNPPLPPLLFPFVARALDSHGRLPIHIRPPTLQPI